MVDFLAIYKFDNEINEDNLELVKSTWLSRVMIIDYYDLD